MTDFPALSRMIEHLNAEINFISLNLEQLEGELKTAQNQDLSDPDEKKVKGAELVRATLAIDKKRIDNAALIDSLTQVLGEVKENLTDKVFTRDSLVQLQQNMGKAEEMAAAFNVLMQQAKEAWEAFEAFIKSDVNPSLHRQVFNCEILNSWGARIDERWTEIRASEAGLFTVATQRWFADIERQEQMTAHAKSISTWG
jgi:predicted  nucleic acid-binding Zn-ribbon protein